MAFIEIQNVSKSFTEAGIITSVLEHLTLHIPKSDYRCLMGPSGSGKTTLLNLISGLDQPTSGTLFVDGTNLGELSETELSEWRKNHIGFIFQLPHLIPVLNTIENIELPLLLFPLSKKDRRKRAAAALEIVNLTHRATYYPRQLSGGQKQRVGIARAISTDPEIIIADEPTGNLDEKASEEILALFDLLNQGLGKTIVMVTHDPKAAERAHQIHHLEKGSLR
jgi:putative ABC transport system ATP-binding protein